MKKLPLFFIAALLTLETARADLRLPAIISDHALLQAGKPVAIWGWATPGAAITVSFDSQGGPPSGASFAATAGPDGKWSGQLPVLATGATGRLLVTSDRDAPKTVDDLVVGEVWLCGGQSNMVYDIQGKFGGNPHDPVELRAVARNIVIARQEAGMARPPVRYFEVAHKGFAQPIDVEGHWVRADPGNVAAFSAVAWNFTIALQSRLHVPVGLIVSCVGGTQVELWMSRPTLAGTAVGRTVLARYDAGFAKMLRKLNPIQTATPLATATFKNMPARLYNAMIVGLEPYTVRGILWFQADGNIGHLLEYGDLFQSLITEWRAEWGEQLPFYFVEMNNMLAAQGKPVQFTGLPLIREQQHAALRLPGVGMVCAIDLGVKNPHFPNKKPVGERLAGLALRDTYHQATGEVDSPLYRGFQVEGSRVRLTFTAAEGLRVRDGGELKGFAIRGSSGPWVWATGKIDGQAIVVWSDKVPAPAAVRYAWAANPVISVENSAGLPLFPFRTDTQSRQ